MRSRMENTSDNEQYKGREGERKGRREKDWKAGTRRSTYRRREERNTREQAREIVGKKEADADQDKKREKEKKVRERKQDKSTERKRKASGRTRGRKKEQDGRIERRGTGKQKNNPSSMGKRRGQERGRESLGRTKGATGPQGPWAHHSSPTAKSPQPPAPPRH